MKSAGKARSNGLYRHIRTSKEIIRNLLNYSSNNQTIKYAAQETNINASNALKNGILYTPQILCHPLLISSSPHLPDEIPAPAENGEQFILSEFCITFTKIKKCAKNQSLMFRQKLSCIFYLIFSIYS